MVNEGKRGGGDKIVREPGIQQLDGIKMEEESGRRKEIQGPNLLQRLTIDGNLTWREGFVKKGGKTDEED